MYKEVSIKLFPDQPIYGWNTGRTVHYLVPIVDTEHAGSKYYCGKSNKNREPKSWELWKNTKNQNEPMSWELLKPAENQKACKSLEIKDDVPHFPFYF